MESSEKNPALNDADVQIELLLAVSIMPRFLSPMLLCSIWLSSARIAERVPTWEMCCILLLLFAVSLLMMMCVLRLPQPIQCPVHVHVELSQCLFRDPSFSWHQPRQQSVLSMSPVTNHYIVNNTIQLHVFHAENQDYFWIWCAVAMRCQGKWVLSVWHISLISNVWDVCRTNPVIGDDYFACNFSFLCPI